jgi:hypothetical protein
MNFTTRLLSAAMAMAAMTSAAHATVYMLSGQDIFPATATGTITTDGTLGVLSQANITGVDITVADASGSVAVDSFTSLYGTDLTATASGLFFTYSGGSNEAFVTFSSDGTSGYCIATGSPTCGGVADNEAIKVNGTIYQGPTLSGSTVEIATAAVPEPATWAMMLLGLGGVGVVLRRRQNGRLVHA